MVLVKPARAGTPLPWRTWNPAVRFATRLPSVRCAIQDFRNAPTSATLQPETLNLEHGTLNFEHGTLNLEL